MEGIGLKLRAIRLQAQLSLRQVEERSLLAAQQGNEPQRISAAWLNRVERDEHELTVSEMVLLADIYRMAAEQLLRIMYPANTGPSLLDRPSSTDPTRLLTAGPLEEQAGMSIPDDSHRDHPPDETMFLSTENGPLLGRYRRGIIGVQDRSLEPMVTPGSTVLIDARKRVISAQRTWKDELMRPIYFLMTRNGYVCCWCELDNKLEWLTLVPHSLSPVSARRWRYRKEVESMGRVVGLFIR